MSAPLIEKTTQVSSELHPLPSPSESAKANEIHLADLFISLCIALAIGYLTIKLKR